MACENYGFYRVSLPHKST